LKIVSKKKYDAGCARKEAPHRIAVDVDPAAFFAHYFGVVRG